MTCCFFYYVLFTLFFSRSKFPALRLCFCSVHPTKEAAGLLKFQSDAHYCMQNTVLLSPFLSSNCVFLFRGWWGMEGQHHRDGIILCQEKQIRLYSTSSQPNSFGPHQNSRCYLLFLFPFTGCSELSSSLDILPLLSHSTLPLCPQIDCPRRNQIKLGEERSTLMQLRSLKPCIIGTRE